MDFEEELLIDIFSYIPRDEENSETFLNIFFLSKKINKTAKNIFKQERKRASAWVQPNCFWALGIDYKSIVALIWSFDEFSCRFPNWSSIFECNPRCFGGLRAMYVQGYLRKMCTTWERPSGIHRYTFNPEELKEEIKEDLKKILVVENLLKKHENLEKWNFKKEIEKSIKEGSKGKYSSHWKGDEIQLLSIIYCVGQMIKEDWSDEGLTTRQKEKIDKILGARRVSESDEKTIREDFIRAFYWNFKKMK